jgi:cytochrome c553
VAFAQDWTQAPSGPALGDRLSDPHTAFRATVSARPTDHLVAAGRLVAMGGAREGGAGMACFSCHGPTGAGDSAGAFPRLAQLPAWYMYKQLEDYASGSRPNEIMTPIAKRLTRPEREAVSAYYALVTAPAPPVADDYGAQALQWGAALNAIGSAEKGIPGCVNCHGPLGSGLPPSVPNLAGQHAEYIGTQLRLWKEGTRKNDPMGVMASIAAKMDDRDIDAVSRYFARLKPAAELLTPMPAQTPPAGPGPQPSASR